jgi:ketosteroid isomerase-like protein
MNHERKGNDQEQIRFLLRRINAAWLKGRLEELEECFHADIVIRGPDLREMARGRESCVRSYADFIRQATVREFQESEPDVSIWGNTAVSIYSWDITYEMKGQEHHERGRDLFVLTRDDGGWRAVWRTVLLSSQP